MHFRTFANNAQDFASRLPLRSRLLNGSTFPGDAAVALRPTENPAEPPVAFTETPQTKSPLNFRNTGKPRIRAHAIAKITTD